MSAPQHPLSVSDVVGLVKGFDPDTSRAALGSLVMGMDALVSSYPHKPAKEQIYMGKRFAKLMASGPLHQRLLSATVWQKLTQSYAPLPRVAKWLRTEQLDINALMHAFHGLIAVAFDGAAGFSHLQRLKLDRHCRRIYARLFIQAHEAYAASLAPLSNMAQNERCIALCVAQFIGRRHAPTAHILSMADVLTQMGYTVKIFNQMTTPRRTASGVYFPYASPKFEQLNDVASLDLASGGSTQFWQNPHDEIREASFCAFRDALTAFGPSKIISLGPANLYADLAGQHIAHVSMPSTIDVAIGAPGRFGCVRPLTPLQLRLLKPLGIAGDDVVALQSGFALPETEGPVTRKEVYLSDDDYGVAIVTNRADRELGEDFLTALTAHLDQNPSIKVRIFGSHLDVASWQKQIFQEHTQISFLGYSTDLFGVLGAFDAVLNPPRQGGGTSGAYAMALGLNVFSLTDCDVANVVGPGFLYGDLEQMLAALSDAACDPSIAAAKAHEAKARWAQISDREGQMQALLDGARKASP